MGVIILDTEAYKPYEELTLFDIALTELLGLRQPTVTHHLNILKSIDAVHVEDRGRERVYTLNRKAHCFEVCHIPY